MAAGYNQFVASPPNLPTLSNADLPSLVGTQNGQPTGCFSVRGAILYERLKAVVENKATTVVLGTAPASGGNTSTVPGGGNVTFVGAISGNRAAYIYTIHEPDGSTRTVIQMQRCGNFVTPAPTSPPGIPALPSPTPTPTTTPTTVPTTTPTTSPEEGKDPTKGIVYSPIPTTVQGCGADGGDTYPCQGNTATNHPVLATPPPAGGTTGCGSDGDQPCPAPTSTTTTTTAPPPPGVTITPAAPGSGAPSPSPAPAAPSATLSPGAA